MKRTFQQYTKPYQPQKKTKKGTEKISAESGRVNPIKSIFVGY